MRNGMSVKEIYDALDQRERLIHAYEKERQQHIELKKAVGDAYYRMSRTVKDYIRIADDPNTCISDHIEFRSRASGLSEAMQILRRIIGKSEKSASNNLD